MSINGFAGFGALNADYNNKYQDPNDKFMIDNPFEDEGQRMDMPFANDDLNKKIIVRQNNTYYQIATFKNKKNKYHVRKFIFNEKCTKMKSREGYLKKDKVEELMDRLGDNRFKCFACFNLDQVEYPTQGDLLAAKSSNINNSNDFSGFAPF